ncbi:MAG TPA: hypothetical protein VFW25_06120 [Silvibacterium sp.]|nr:hypothetical protein [Silvibacterium sp.]
MSQKRYSAVRHLPALACFAFCTCGFGQVAGGSYGEPVAIAQTAPPATPAQPAPTPTPSTAASGKPAAGTPATPPPATPPPAAPPASLLSQPPQTAKVNLSDGKLAIQADNSSLLEILHQVSKDSGMKIEGLGGRADQRIFGSYGPGAPRDVLSDLLSGSGLNVLMLGVTASGAPRELALTSRTGEGGAGAAPQPNASPEQSQPEAPPPVQYPNQYPNQDQQPQQPGPTVMRNGVRTPQQMLEELQRMREQQQQQQEQQQQDQQQTDQDQDQPQPDQQQ